MNKIKKVIVFSLSIGMSMLLLVVIYTFFFGEEIVINVVDTVDKNTSQILMEADVTSCKCLGIAYKDLYWPGVPWKCFGLKMMCTTRHVKPYIQMGFGQKDYLIADLRRRRDSNPR